MKTKNQNYRTKLKIVFLGTHRLAQIVLEKLIDSQFKPQLVITGHDRKSGRGQILKSTPIKEIAQKAAKLEKIKLPLPDYLKKKLSFTSTARN